MAHPELVRVYDDGTGGQNEVARWRLGNGPVHEWVLKTMIVSRPKVHQRRKALTEATFFYLGRGLGGDMVTTGVTEVGMWDEQAKVMHAYHMDAFGEKNVDGWQRLCYVKREFAPGWSGIQWRERMHSAMMGDLEKTDATIRGIIESHPDAARIALLDLITGNQDRSARNWCYDGNRFYAIDNGMAWFHEYYAMPRARTGEEVGWRVGFVIDDVIIQVGDWAFISGVFATLWAGRPMPEALMALMEGFGEEAFLESVASACERLRYPDLSADWRFEGLLRRMRWMRDNRRFPTADEYRSWRENDEHSLLTPEAIVETGGREIWKIEMDYQHLEGESHRRLLGQA